MSWRNAAELQSEATVPYIVRTSVARRIQLGAVRILQTKIAEGSDGIMAKLQYIAIDRGHTNTTRIHILVPVRSGNPAHCLTAVPYW